MPGASEVPRACVLLADDNADMLEADGHVVVTAKDAREGVDAFLAAQTTDSFGVVITDLGMPHLDGHGVAKAVKEASPRTPVILLTGWGARPGLDAEVPAHVDRVLGKPAKLRELRAALAECCSVTE
jgi:DNA-binding response OmpR family regulator